MGEERKHKHLTVHRFGVGPGIGLGTVMVALSLLAGLLGPVAIAVYSGGAHHAGVGGMVLARAARMKAADGGPAAQQRRRRDR